jgi:hypothetical protein
MDYEERIDQFEENLRRLKAMYDLFFNGARKLPPTEDRRRLDAMVHELAREKIRENGLRFRLNTTMGRYNQYKELWGRLMREREEGPTDFRKRKTVMSSPAPERMAEPAPRPTEARVTSDGSDPYVKVGRAGDTEAMSEIFKQIADANKKLGKAAIPLEQVTAMVQKQVELLSGRYKTNTFGFRVDTSEGKVKLKAKPIQE